MSTDDAANPVHLTDKQRLALLERDSRDHAKTLTTIIDKIGQGFTEEQIDQIRAAFRQELADSGLRIDEAEHQDAAREDFRFLRRLRLNWDGAVNKTGTAVLLAILGIASTVIALGFWSWLSNNIQK